MSNENKITDVDATLPVENNEFVDKGIGFAIARRDMNVRAGADMSDKIVGFLPRREQVEVLEILPNAWYKIAWPNIACGYAYVSNVSNKYFSYESNNERSAPKAYIISVLNTTEVKANPQENSETVMKLNKGAAYTIIEEQNGWGKLKGNKGWIRLDTIKRLA